MNRSSLRIGVIVLTVITLLIHAYLGLSSLGAPDMQSLAILWILNAVGYLGLLLSFLGYVPFFKGKLVEWALIAFAIVTILAWVLMSGVLKPGYHDILAYITKVDEVVLIIATFLYSRA
jgi:hypothetical protein